MDKLTEEQRLEFKKICKAYKKMNVSDWLTHLNKKTKHWPPEQAAHLFFAAVMHCS